MPSFLAIAAGPSSVRSCLICAVSMLTGRPLYLPPASSRCRSNMRLPQRLSGLLDLSACGVPFTLQDIDPCAQAISARLGLIGASSEPVDLRRQSVEREPARIAAAPVFWTVG